MQCLEFEVQVGQRKWSSKGRCRTRQRHWRKIADFALGIGLTTCAWLGTAAQKEDPPLPPSVSFSFSQPLPPFFLLFFPFSVVSNWLDSRCDRVDCHVNGWIFM